MPKSLEERRQTLLAMQRRFRHLAGEFQAALVDSTSADQGITDSSAGTGDSEYADAATDLYDAEMAQTMRLRYRNRLADVEVALRRIADGTYGHCAECQSVIPEARLEMMPETIYCTEHAMSLLGVDDQAAGTPKPWPGEPWSA